jgi:hypothetical protein
MYSAAARFIADGHPVVAIAVDRHPARSADDLRRDLSLDRPLIDVLQDWTSDKQGVLFIDALDATRGGPSDGVFQDLSCAGINRQEAEDEMSRIACWVSRRRSPMPPGTSPTPVRYRDGKRTGTFSKPRPCVRPFPRWRRQSPSP